MAVFEPGIFSSGGGRDDYVLCHVDKANVYLFLVLAYALYIIFYRVIGDWNFISFTYSALGICMYILL
jgi:hypothetical protein